MSATSKRIWRHPYSTFSRLADGPINPAWNFAFWWTVGLIVLRQLSVPEEIGRLIVLVPIGGLIQGAVLILEATLFHGALRLVRCQSTWSLAARTHGYSRAWLGPSALLWTMADWAPLLELFWALAVIASLIHVVGVTLSFFAVAHGRLGRRAGTAAAVTLVGTAPTSLMALVALLLSLVQDG